MTMRSLVLGTLTLVACHDGLDWPEPPVRWRSEHFVYRSEVEVTDESAWFERHFARETARFGVEWPAETVIDYRQIDDLDRAKAACFYGSACEYDGVILTTLPFHTHELIHAYLEPFGVPHPVLVEGMAMAYGCVVPSSLVATTNIEPTEDADLLFSAEFYASDEAVTWTNYRRAASFTAFLLHRFGLARVLDLYRRLGHDADPGEVDRALRSAFSASLAEVLGEWVARGQIGSDDYCIWPEVDSFEALPIASPTAILLDSSPRVQHADLGLRLSAQRRLEVTTSGTYRIQLAPEGELNAALLRDVGAPLFVGVWATASVSRDVLTDLERGTYWLDLRGNDARVSVEWREEAPIVGAQCGGARSLELATGLTQTSVVWRIPADACDGGACRGWVTLSAGVNTTVAISAPPTAIGFVTTCEGDCATCAANRSSQIAIPANEVVHAQWELQLPSPAVFSGIPIVTLTSSS